MLGEERVVLIIPALDEEASIGAVLAAVDRALVDDVIVVDNGSRDATATRASAAGACVVTEPRRGYGSACLCGIAAARDAGIFLFMDGDGSDDPREAERLLDAMRDRGIELVIGSRTRGEAEPGALTPVQAFGNALTCWLVRLFWKVRYTDLGPLRAIRVAALEQLAMRDPDFGWTIEMQVKAAQRGLRTVEVPVNYRRRRAGASKVSGNLIGSTRAGIRILTYVLVAWWQDLHPGASRAWKR